MAARVSTLTPEKAASTLEESLRDFRGELTVADAATRGGLALREAERGLHALVVRYDGHLAATEKGELIFRFPEGFVARQPDKWLRRAARTAKRALIGAGRFVVRAWVSVVLVGYALVLGAVLLALALRQSDDDRDGGVTDILAVLGRVLLEAVYWTFHPFSPVFVAYEPGWVRVRARRRPALPFYDRVNRFVFGPPPVPVDARQQRRDVLAEIRRLQGRVGAADLMAVTGWSRAQAEAELSRLLLDLDGEVRVTEDGAIVYEFASLRSSAHALALAKGDGGAPTPIWNNRIALPPLTGNGAGSNVMFGAINGFNLLASGYALGRGLTLERLAFELSHRGDAFASVVAPPADGLPWALGVVPFAFSLALFALPLGRWALRGRKRREVERENGRRAVLKAVLGGAPCAEVPAAELDQVFARAAGRLSAVAGQEASKDGVAQDVLAVVRELGGEYELNAKGEPVYRFGELHAQRAALGTLRARASADEAGPGRVIFSSDA